MPGGLAVREGCSTLWAGMPGGSAVREGCSTLGARVSGGSAVREELSTLWDVGPCGLTCRRDVKPVGIVRKNSARPVMVLRKALSVSPGYPKAKKICPSMSLSKRYRILVYLHARQFTSSTFCLVVGASQKEYHRCNSSCIVSNQCALPS